MGLDAHAEDRLTTWLTDHLLLRVPCGPKDETDALEAQRIEEHQPALHTDGTEHERLLMDLKRGFLTGITRPS